MDECYRVLGKISLNHLTENSTVCGESNNDCPIVHVPCLYNWRGGWRSVHPRPTTIDQKNLE
jgi:hypothetical protein